MYVLICDVNYVYKENFGGAVHYCIKIQKHITRTTLIEVSYLTYQINLVLLQIVQMYYRVELL